MPTAIFHTFSVTIPPGTLRTAPTVTPTVFNPAIVDRIEWRFPSGCNGVVGIQIGARNVPVVPSGIHVYFIRSGDSQGFDLDSLHDSGDWSVIGFNEGSFAHTVQVTFRVHRLQPEPEIPAYLVASFAGILQGGE